MSFAVVSYRADGAFDQPDTHGSRQIESEPVQTEQEASEDLYSEVDRARRRGAEIVELPSFSVHVDGSNRAQRVYTVERV